MAHIMILWGLLCFTDLKRIRKVDPMNWKLFVNMVYWATSMLVTDVGDEICWWQLWDIGDRFEILVAETANMILSPIS